MEEKGLTTVRVTDIVASATDDDIWAYRKALAARHGVGTVAVKLVGVRRLYEVAV